MQNSNNFLNVRGVPNFDSISKSIVPKLPKPEIKKEPAKKGKYADILNEFTDAGFTRAMIGERVGVSGETVRRYQMGEFTSKTEKLIEKAFGNVPHGLKRIEMYHYMCPESNVEYLAKGKNSDKLIDALIAKTYEIKDGLELARWMTAPHEGFRLNTVERAMLEAYPEKEKKFGETYMFASREESGFFTHVPEDLTVAEVLEKAE